MKIKLGIIMDSISSINIEKDSSFAILLEAQNRNYELYYMEISFIYVLNNTVYSFAYLLSVMENNKKWYKFTDKKHIQLNKLDVIFMRKDPPFDSRFLHITYILEHIQTEKKILIINDPKSLRNFDEKLSTLRFPSYIPETLISCHINTIKNFLKENQKIIVKPIGNKGGKSVFYIHNHDPNSSVIIETITNYEKNFCIAQKYIPSIREEGDKRIIVIDGKAVPYCMARIPMEKEIRGNLSSGGYGKIQPLNDYDHKIVQSLSKFLKKNNLLFVGLDVIGKFLTEINITSPTCIREIEKYSSYPITHTIMNVIENKLKKNLSSK